MKNKTLQRVLSFALALILCFTWNIAEPLVASAFAIELGWVTYALISFLAASGFTFAVVGGIDALKTEVEEKVDTYYQVTGIDLYQLMAQSIKLSSPNNNGGKPGLWFTVAAVTAIAEFIQWVIEQGWSEGEEVTTELPGFSIKAKKYNSGVAEEILIENTFISDFDTALSHHFEVYKLGTVFSFDDVDVDVSNSTYQKGITFYNGTYEYGFALYFYDTAQTRLKLDLYRNGSNYASYNVYEYLETYGYTYADVVGFTFTVTKPDNHEYIKPSVYLLALLADGTVCYLKYCGINRDTDVVSSGQSSSIAVPDTITEFDIDENEVVEISFDGFAEDATFETPEELAEAVGQQIIDTGTTPDITTEVITDPDTEPDPTPVPTPIVQAPEEPTYPDVSDLGLPALGKALMNKFPFCLPMTLSKVLDIFKADRQTPKWTVEFPAPLNTSFELDLSGYEAIGTVTRWMTTIGYCLALALGTRKLINW